MIFQWNNAGRCHSSTLTLGYCHVRRYLRQVRATVLEELGKDYVLAMAGASGKASPVEKRSRDADRALCWLCPSAACWGRRHSHYWLYFHVDGVGKLAVDSITMRGLSTRRNYVILNWPYGRLITDILTIPA